MIINSCGLTTDVDQRGKSAWKQGWILKTKRTSRIGMLKVHSPITYSSNVVNSREQVLSMQRLKNISDYIKYIMSVDEKHHKFDERLSCFKRLLKTFSRQMLHK